jgi:hypothetical protein
MIVRKYLRYEFHLVDSVAQSLTQEAWAILALIRRYPGVPLHIVERDFHHIYNQIPRSLELLWERKMITYRLEVKHDMEKGSSTHLTFHPK